MGQNVPRIEVSREGGITIVDLLDQEILEEHVIANIADSLFAVVAEEDAIKLVLSFARVKHLSSSALGTLIRLNKRVDECGGQLKLCDIKDALYEIFVITKLNKLFDIYENESMAVSSLQR